MCAGAEQVTLEGIYHSPLGSAEAVEGVVKAGRPWYGSPGTLELWLSHIADESELTLDSDQSTGAPPPEVNGAAAEGEVVGVPTV